MTPTSYVCPHCGIETVTIFHYVLKETEASILLSDKFRRGNIPNNMFYSTDELTVTTCLRCKKPIFWVQGQMVWPIPKGIPASPDMPEKARKFFEEAQSILYFSPRSACALLRICLELLVNDAGKEKEGFNIKDTLIKRIESLGVNQDIRNILNTCRMLGNANAHPGVLDLSEADSIQVAIGMSELLNTLVEIWIKPQKQARELLRKIGKG